jgi:hypothetical protein
MSTGRISTVILTLRLPDPACYGYLIREKWQSPGRHRRGGVCERQSVRGKSVRIGKRRRVHNVGNPARGALLINSWGNIYLSEKSSRYILSEGKKAHVILAAKL